MLRFFTFFKFGPREFGYHPVNKAFLYVNRRMLMSQAFWVHRYSYLKALTHNGYHMVRPFGSTNAIGPLFAIVGACIMIPFGGMGNFLTYCPDRLSYLKTRVGDKRGVNLNALNERLSAHYIEINTLYMSLILKEYYNVKKEILEDRNKHTTAEKKNKIC